MTNNQKVLAIFEDAWELAPGEVAAFLDERCGDDAETRAAVERLLDADQNAGGFLLGDTENSDGFRYAVGDVLAGRYSISAQIGRGGMGEVYRVEDQELQRTVAIKTLARGNYYESDFRDRFEREIKSVAALNHANVVTLFDVVRDGETSFAIMEFVEGETLREMLQSGDLDPEMVRSIAVGIAAGLGAAHARQLMHRDIKPENVIVTPDGTAKLLDFGIARPVSPTHTQLLTGPESR